MWNSAYTYPSPASHTPAVIPSLVLPVSTCATSGTSSASALAPSSSSKSTLKTRKRHESKARASKGDNATSVIVHKHKHQHRHQHIHHCYLHIDPSHPQNGLRLTDAPTLLPSTRQGVAMEGLTTSPLFYPGTHISNFESLGQPLTKLDVASYSQAAVSEAPVTGPSNVDRSLRSGRKKALCIGINYTGQDKALRGCVNDAKRVRKFLIEYHGYSSDNILLLTDEGNASGIATRSNILKCMRWLVKDARRGDSLFFHFSGHGGQVMDIDGDESDGMDEVVYPVDYKRHGYIVDDDIHAIMVKWLPADCRLTALFDSCHSGTALDLPYLYSSTGRLKNSHLSKRAARKATTANVVSWAACQDGEKAKDTFSIDGSAIGAMSHAFVNILKRNPKLPYKDLLKFLNAELQGHDQKPQLSSSHRINTNDFVII